MVKDHSDSERGNLLPPHGLLFPNSSKGSFICTKKSKSAVRTFRPKYFLNSVKIQVLCQ